MAVVVIPIISSPQYNSFRGEADIDLPDTYDEWLNLMEQARLENERRQMREAALSCLSDGALNSPCDERYRSPTRR